MNHRGCQRSKRRRVEHRSSRRTAAASRNTYRTGELEYWWHGGEATEQATAIREVLDNPALARAMGEAGRQRAVERFSWDVVSRRLADLVESVPPAPGSQDGERTTAAHIPASGR
jgi:glycosyltransferase involved in cell wall biosynthesis